LSNVGDAGQSIFFKQKKKGSDTEIGETLNLTQKQSKGKYIHHDKTDQVDQF